MKRNEITSEVLIYASVMLIFIESLTVVAISKTSLQSLPLIGLARIAETVFLLFIISRLRDGLVTLGFAANKIPQGLKKGLFWSACIGISSAIVLGVLYFLNSNLLDIFKSQAPTSISGLILLFIVGGFISPIAEEIFFRGIVFGFLRRWGFILALLVSTILFGLAHALTSGAFFIQIIGGLIFTIAYEVEKNLLVPITIHVLGNMAIFTLSLLMAL